MRRLLVLCCVLLAAPAQAQAPDGPVSKTMRDRAVETVGAVRDTAEDLADRALDAVPFWDRQDRSEPLDAVLARVSRDLAAAHAADPEWVQAAEPELRALAEALARLPPPPEPTAAVALAARPAPAPPREFRPRPVWPGAAAAAEADAMRPGAPQTGFAAEAGRAQTLAPPEPPAADPPPAAAPAAAPAQAERPAQARRTAAATPPRPRVRRVARSQPSRPPAPVAPATVCPSACPAPAPLDGSTPFGVILGAYPTSEQARTAWTALGQTEPELITDLQPRLFSAPEAGSVMLLAGPLANRAAAEARCAKARREGAACATGRFEGEAF
jgi:hypothetical protein